jgi:pilus assembly protein CpaC
MAHKPFAAIGRIALAAAIGLVLVGRGGAQTPPPDPGPQAGAHEVGLPGIPMELPGALPDPANPLPIERCLEGQTGVRQLPLRGPKPAEEVDAFLEPLTGHDAAFRVVVGQSRVLTTKEDITTGQQVPLVAVGDPSIIDFQVLNSRQIRITGERIGTTDLTITTGGGRSFTFEVRVENDLTLLRCQLRALFPDATLKLTQVHANLVVEGQARDAVQVKNIIDTVQAYQRMIAAQREREIRNETFTGSGLPQPGPGSGTGAMPTPGFPTPGGVPQPPQPGAGEEAPRDPNAAPAEARKNPAEDPNLKRSSLAPNVQYPMGLPMGGGAPLAGDAAPFGGMGGGPSAYVNAGQIPLDISGRVTAGEVINLIRVPGSQQVLLKVRIAELNRSALRQIGSNFLGVDPDTGAIFGTQIAGPVTAAGGTGRIQGTQLTPGRNLGGAVLAPTSAATTVFGIFQDGGFEFTMNALRQNALLKILAEPNLIAMNGHRASFLAGGQFPVPVPQVSAAGVAPTVTVQFKEFGVRLGFVPYILDNDMIRLSVAPEVSQIDRSISVTLVAGGSPVPGLSTRSAQTTVELHEGQTLAIAGLLQLDLSGTTRRIPGLGDLPIIGPFFSNTTGERIEKELVVLVTPYLVEGMSSGQVPPFPGSEVKEPNDIEFYLLNRIEGRTGVDFRSTTQADDPLHLVPLLHLQSKYVAGPCGYSD